MNLLKKKSYSNIIFKNIHYIQWNIMLKFQIDQTKVRVQHAYNQPSYSNKIIMKQQ